MIELDKSLQEYLDKLVAEQVKKEVAAKLAALSLYESQPRKEQPHKIALIVTKGTLDMAYPPLVLATTAAASGAEVVMYCTLYGVNLLRQNAAPRLAPIGNPAMPVKVPNIIGMLPGMTALATRIMKGRIAKNQIATIPELFKNARKLKVKLIACQMAMDVMGLKKEELMEDVEIGDATTFLKFGFDADVTLLI
jgi:peroxiredoxin family protein